MKNFILVILALFSLSANAASVTYLIDQSNDLADGVAYATVTLTESFIHAGDIEVTVSLNESAFPTPLSNFGLQTFSFNYDVGNLSKGNIKDLQPSDWDLVSNRNAGGGFGKFDLMFKGDGDSRTSELSFRITKTGDSLTSYALGDTFFAAHIAGYADTETGNTSGKFGGSTVSSVPIPAAAWLMLSGICLMVFASRRKPA